MQRDGSGQSSIHWLRDLKGGSVYLRLSTRSIAQPKRTLSADDVQSIIGGGYWLKPPAEGADLAIVYTGAVAPEAIAAHAALIEDVPGAGLLAVTSADRLNAGWHAAERVRRKAARSLSEVARSSGDPNASSRIRSVTVADEGVAARTALACALCRAGNRAGESARPAARPGGSRPHRRRHGQGEGRGPLALDGWPELRT